MTVTAATRLGFDDPSFRRRRVQNWLVLGLLYAFFYASRYNLSALAGQLSKSFGWTNAEYGVLETVMPFIYGASVLVNGPIADRVGGKRAFLFGAVGVVVMNFLFGLGTFAVVTPAVWAGAGKAAVVVTPAIVRGGVAPASALAIMAVLWGLNGYFQSFGALSIVKVNAQWFHISERGTFAGIFGVLIRFGLILAFSGVPLLVSALSPVWGFWGPALGVAVVLTLNVFLMENTPADAGFPGLDTGDGSAVDDEKPAPLNEILLKVFRSRAAWAIAGIGGGFAFGIASDRIFNTRRAPVITVGFAGMAVFLACVGIAHNGGAGPWAVALCLACLSFFINGSHGMISGAASMDFGGRKAAATAAGLFDGIQYFTSAPFVGYGMGKLIDTWTWSAWAWAPIPFAIIGALVMSTLWNVTPGKRSH